MLISYCTKILNDDILDDMVLGDELYKGQSKHRGKINWLSLDTYHVYNENRMRGKLEQKIAFIFI